MTENIKRISDRYQNKTQSKQASATGNFKKVSPIIGTWFESLITKLDSLQTVMGYSEKIADKEFLRLQKKVIAKYGQDDNLTDVDEDAYEDPLVQAFMWVDNFYSMVRKGKYSPDLTSSRKKLEMRKMS